MSMGQAFRKILCAEQRRALRQAWDVLLDELLDELPRADAQRTNLDLEEFSIELLPPQYHVRYTERFGRRFLAFLMTMGWKPNQPELVPMTLSHYQLCNCCRAHSITMIVQMQIMNRMQIRSDSPYPHYIA